METAPTVGSVEYRDETLARSVAEEHVRGRRRRGWLMVAGGVAALAAGLAGFGVYSARADSFAERGVHTTAVVTGMHTGIPFDGYLLVAFRTRAASEQGVHVRTGDRLRLHHVGERIEIVYDAADPRRAQVAGRHDIGPVGVPFACLLALGAILVAAGAQTLRMCRAARRALRTHPRAMRAASYVVRRGGRGILLVDGPRATAVSGLRRRDWWGPEFDLETSAPELLPVCVFRDPKGGRVMVVADAARDGVAVGRELRVPRLLRLLAPRAWRAHGLLDAFAEAELQQPPTP